MSRVWSRFVKLSPKAGQGFEGGVGRKKKRTVAVIEDGQSLSLDGCEMARFGLRLSVVRQSSR